MEEGYGVYIYVFSGRVYDRKSVINIYYKWLHKLKQKQVLALKLV